MPDLKISQLTAGDPAQGTDEIPAARAGANVRVTAQSIADLASAAAAVPSDFQPAIVTGNYYYPKYMAFSTSVAYLGNVLSAVPIWFSHTETWTRIGMNVLTADAGKSVRFGLYANGTDNLPGALVADLGTISLTATGYIELTISQSLTANTVYWIAAVADTDGTLPTAEVDLWYFAASGGTTLFSTYGGILGYPQPLDPSAASLITVPVVRAFTYAAMPDPWGTPDGDFTPDQYAPAIWLRKV